MTASTPSALPAFLTPNCNACSGLCCVVLPFDAAQGFGFDKPAHTPCQHLQANFRCEIHSQLSKQGFSGCVQYNCFGAGQAAMKLVSGSPWTQSQEHAENVFEIFTRLRPLHELMAKLSLVAESTDDSPLKARLLSVLTQIEQASQDCKIIDDHERVAQLQALGLNALQEFTQSKSGVAIKQRLRTLPIASANRNV
jgi:hypothetical protein